MEDNTLKPVIRYAILYTDTVNLIASENGKQIMPSTQHNFYVTHGDSALHFVGV